VKDIKTYFLVLFLFSAATAIGQTKQDSPPTSFPDSIRAMLEKTRKTDAVAVADEFGSAWSSLGPDHQNAIQRHYRMMKRKRFPLRPHIQNYFSAIANAVSFENADQSKLTGYLRVAGLVIEKESTRSAQAFFEVSKTFFGYHALHFEKTFRLYARDDDYSFDYIEPAPMLDISESTSQPIVEDDNSGQAESYDDASANFPLFSNDDQSIDNDPAYDSVYVSAPLWMDQPVQPFAEGPVLRFNRVSLDLVTRYDSVQLKNTKGLYAFRIDEFIGEEGSFDWTSAGLSPDSVHCEFTKYHFSVKRPEINSQLVKLNYVGVTPGFIPGTFEFKSQPRRDSVASTYPRFRSFQNDLKILGIGDENVRYTGGFSLIGNVKTGESVGGGLSTIEVYNNGEKKFTAKAPDFTFSDSTISAQRTQINIPIENDSITHSRVRMKYSFGRDSLQRLLLQRDKGSMKHTPYSATFFSVDFAADVIKWDLYSDSLNILTDGGRATVPMIIESIDFYDPVDFRLLSTKGFTFHPLALVANYCLRNKTREFYSGDLAVFAQKESREIQAAIEFLNEKGMITYFPKSDLVHVKEKAILVYLAYRGEMDYDNLKIHSVIDSFPNASLNFEKRYMVVRGVEEFKVSDSLNVRIEPDSSVITILQNRDIKFDGTINAGNFEISGKGFTLKYDSFFISLAHIDSINFFITETNARGQSTRRKVNNSMVATDSTSAAVGGLGDTSKSSGTLFISKANNKSGKSKVPHYPRLDATAGGVIYFDRDEVLGGVYDKSMFFVVPPFELDSLNNADPASINFDGTFVSSGMFPTFKEKLHTQPDKSLGFDHIIPPGGYRLYNGDGKMRGGLTMNSRGLRGAGTIDYLAAAVNANDFVFYPDSVIARGTEASITAKQFGDVKFPDAALNNFEMKWYPKSDEMKIRNMDLPFALYEGSAQMRGTLTVSKEGVAGAGRLETRGTELVSRYMNFTSTDFGARHARFKVNSPDPEKPLLQGTDVRLKFNLEQNYADISPEVKGVAAITFPFAQFKTSIPTMRWDLNAQKITMSKDPDVPLENSYFYTTREDLDSLNFNAEGAEYDLATQQLKVTGIPYIIVADAKITPQNNEVLILENAKIGTLSNTTIVLDTLNGYHRLTEGVVDIVSRKEFSGYATYQYVNFLKDTFAIKMTDFHLEPISQTEKSRRSSKRDQSEATMQTVGTGAVNEQENLILGAGMYYKGDMIMYATRPALQLSGYVKLDIKNLPDYHTWIQYEQTGDETDVVIDFNNATTEEGKRVNAGLHVSSTDNDLYITFLNDKKAEYDDDFFLPQGMLYYDTASREFKIEDMEKAAGNKLSGKVFAYNDETKQVRFEGPVNLIPASKDLTVTASALGQGDLETNEIRMNSFLMVDSNVPVQAFDIMARQIIDVIKNEGAEEGLGDQTELLYKIGDIVGERMVKDFEQRSLQGYVSLGTLAPLAKPLVFSNVSLKWSPKHKAFYSEGKLGMSNIGRNDINGAFDGFIEIKQSEDGAPVFHVFVKASPEAWYYFGLEDSRLLVQSSNAEFNSVISKKTNAGKAKLGEIAFLPGSDDETLAFINRFRRDYFGIEVPYNLYENTSAIKKQDEKKKEDDGF
jgi:hypothetical protein